MLKDLNLTFEKQKIDDIFEVSINSKKLMAILKQLQDNQIKLEKKIQRIDDFYKDGDSALNKKIINLEANTKNILNQQTQVMKQQMAIQMRKYEQKYIQQLCQKQQKIKQLKYSLQTLNDKINKVNTNLAEEINQSVRNYSAENFALKRTFEKSEELVQNALSQIFDKLQTFKGDIQLNKENIFDMQIKVKKYTEMMLRPADVDRITCPDKKFQDSIDAEKYAYFLKTQKESEEKRKNQNKSPSKQKNRNTGSKIFSNTVGSLKKSRALRNTATETKQPSKQNYMSTLQYASISAKVQNLEKTFKQTTQKFSNQPSLFKRSGKTNMMKTFSYSKEEGQKFFNQTSIVSDINMQQMTELQILEKIVNKLQAVANSVDTKEKNLKKMIEQVKQKQITNSEKIDFQKQKNSKLNSEINELKVKLIGIEKKVGQQPEHVLIANIEAQLCKIIQRLDKQFQVKLNIEEYNLDKVKINEKLDMIRQNLIYKAEKDDVKKAINFLEDKIKQIILVMANEFNEQKLGAISKIPVKCLTCDKQVLKFNTNTLSGTGCVKGLQSSRQLNQKYYTRLLKSNKQNRQTKRNRQNYTSVTQVTQQNL